MAWSTVGVGSFDERIHGTILQKNVEYVIFIGGSIVYSVRKVERPSGKTGGAVAL